MYFLSANLVGHEEDVKALVFQENRIFSVSRDSTVRKWSLSEPNHWSGSIIYKGAKYFNSVAANQTDHSVIVGGQDPTILVLDDEKQLTEDARLFLVGHESNVCALDINSKSNLIASGSWDKTARVWSHGQCTLTLSHDAAVWAVLFLSDGRLLTASADLSIKLWSSDGQLVHIFKGHTDAVRGLAQISEDSFASCSNDGTIRLWSISGKTSTSVLKGHTSFVYSIDYIGKSGLLISSGEDRSVRIWDLSKNGDCIQVITLPAISLWSCKADQTTGDFAVGGSDCIVRVFTQNDSKKASKDEIRHLEESVASSSIGKDQVGEVSDDQLSDPSVLKHPGKKEGEVAMVKTPVGTIEAHQWTSGSWIKIGEVVGKASAGGSGSSNRTASHNGKLYDYVFDVDVEDGKPPLKLAYNNTDNPYTAADKFLAENELPASYREEVVRFILTNAQPVEIGSGPVKPQKQPTKSSSNIVDILKSLKIIPHTSFIQLTSYNAATILKQLTTVNEREDVKLGQGDIENIRQGLENGVNQGNSSDILKSVVFMTQNWKPENILVALDILRIIVPHLRPLPTAVILQQIFSTLDAGVPRHALLSLRSLVNMFDVPDGRKLVTSAQVEEQALHAIEEITHTQTTSTMQIAISSVLLNYSVLANNDGDKALGLLNIISSCRQFSDSEARYRSTLAMGTIIANCPTQEIKSAVNTFDLNDLLKDNDEARFKDLISEIKRVLDNL